MTTRLLAVFFLALMAIANAAPAFVQGASGYASNSVSATANISATVSGNFLVVVVINDESYTTPPTMSSTGGSCTSWVTDVNTTSGSGYFNITLFHCVNIPSGITAVTATLGESSHSIVVIAAEFSGVATASVSDGTNTNSGGSGNVSSAAISTTNADDLLIMAGGWGDFSVTGPSNSYANVATPDQHGDPISGAMAYRIVSSTGSYSSEWTCGSCTQWGNVAQAFKGAGGGSPAVIRRRPITFR